MSYLYRNQSNIFYCDVDVFTTWAKWDGGCVGI